MWLIHRTWGAYCWPLEAQHPPNQLRVTTTKISAHRASDQEMTDCGYQVPVMKKQVLNIFCDSLVMSQKCHLKQILTGQRTKSQRAKAPQLGCRKRGLTLADVVPIDLVDKIRSLTMWYLKAIQYLAFPSVLTMLVYLGLYFLSIHYIEMRFPP